jgi:hypothetical protein
VISALARPACANSFRRADCVCIAAPPVDPKAGVLAPPKAVLLAPKGVEPAPLNAGVLCANENAGADVAPKPGVAPPPKGDAGVVLPNRVLALDAPNAGAARPKPPAAGVLDAPKVLPKALVPPNAGVLAAADPKAGVLAWAPNAAGCEAPKPPPNPVSNAELFVQHPSACITSVACALLSMSHAGQAAVDVPPKGDEVVLPNSPPLVLAAPKAGCAAPKAGAAEPKAEPPKAGADCCA